MAAAIAAIFIITVVVIGAVVVFIRAEVSEVSAEEARLHAPDTPTVAYAIPNGVDPVVIRTALSMEGFRCVPDRVGDAECLLIECAPEDRERARLAIAGVHMTTYDGRPLDSSHVVFQHER